MIKRALDGETQDIHARESFTRLNDFYNSDPFIKGNFRFFEFAFTNSTGGVLTLTDTLIPHGLSFTPRDVVQTSIIGSSWVWNFAKFTQTDLVATVQIAANSTTTVRAFIGRYEEGRLNG